MPAAALAIPRPRSLIAAGLVMAARILRSLRACGVCAPGLALTPALDRLRPDPWVHFVPRNDLLLDASIQQLLYRAQQVQLVHTDQ